MTPVARCENCCISSKFPGIKLSAAGLCNLCEGYDKTRARQVQDKNAGAVRELIEKARGTGSYDVLVAYSGGKDSSYVLKHMKQEFGLNVLAMMIDNNFISDIAFKNARAVTSSLGVDLMIFKVQAKLMNKLYKKSLNSDIYSEAQLTRANAACLSCIKTINALTLNEAILRKIPLLAGGYIEGQVPAGTGHVNTRYLRAFNKQNSDFLAQNIDPEFSKLLEPQATEFYPHIIYPMMGMEYSEEDVIREITPLGWTYPPDTGLSSSNCQLNDYAIAVHHSKYHFHPYEAEIASQARAGTITKEYALRRLEVDRKPAEFVDVLHKLEQ